MPHTRRYPSSERVSRGSYQDRARVRKHRRRRSPSLSSSIERERRGGGHRHEGSYLRSTSYDNHSPDRRPYNQCYCEGLCVQMYDWFDYHGHMCISFELLALSTFDFLKENNYLSYSIGQVRHMAYQICQAIKCEYTHANMHMSRLVFVFP
ncbi:hypothetical protein AAFF_G00019930 [Aldrovandia affinis]|uniref:dual-specificity kinase n=1 Tax=Aldrovandia affinis TaxID=143900 RepID=A0AAD7R2K2_9TELE|nr:hypothetical protein AAFF_G00019930 [Aldrovandia affinis]